MDDFCQGVTGHIDAMIRAVLEVWLDVTRDPVALVAAQAKLLRGMNAARMNDDHFEAAHERDAVLESTLSLHHAKATGYRARSS